MTDSPRNGTPTTPNQASTPRTPRQAEKVRREKNAKGKEESTGSNTPTTPNAPDDVAGGGDSAQRKEGQEIYQADPHIWEEILAANGWTKQDLYFNRDKMTHLELFLLSIAKVPQIAYFPNLVDCKMMHISLKEIGSSFEKLTSLKRLWLNENRLTKISGLENCISLQELYLHGNSIVEIRNLDHLVNLEVLWLSNNEIRVVKNLENLTKLRSLWIAGNKLVALDKFYTQNLALEDLNVAGNQIASFREVPPLSQLPKLSKLYFSDPTFGDNPLCALCNYTIYTLYHLPKVTCLDFMVVGQDQRSLAVATFTKKTMYYMMRIKTLRRNTLQLVGACETQHVKKMDEVSLPLDSLQRQRAVLVQQMNEVKHFGDLLDFDAPVEEKSDGAAETKGESAMFLVELKTLIGLIDKALQEKDRERFQLGRELSVATGEITQTTENQVARLLLELSTGGNVRIEEGKPKDVWHKSCVELVKTRFFCHEFDPFGIRDVKITKVSRLYNRALRGRFDSTLDDLVDVHDHSYKRALEYLFFVDVNGVFTQDTMYKLLETGFRREDFPQGIPMTNSLFLAEQLRMVTAFKNGELSGRKSNPRTLMTQILVAKVFLGKCAAEKKSSPSTAETDDAAGKNMIPVVTSGTPIDKNDYADTTLSVYRAKPNDSRQRIWFCVDPNLVLPEYIVDAAYVAGPLVPLPAVVEWGGDDKTAQVTETLTKLFPTATKVDLGDFALTAPYYMNLVKSSDSLTSAAAASKTVANVTEHINSNKRQQQQKKSKAQQEPLVEFDANQWHKGMLTWGKLRPKFESSDAPAPNSREKLEVADFSGRGLSSLGVIFSSPKAAEVFGHLTTLVLSFNEIGKLDVRLSTLCPELTSVDLSHNHIRKVEGAFNGLIKLTTLRLGSNMIQRMECLQSFAPAFLPELTDLSLQGNPVQSSVKAYRTLLVSHLPRLKLLDDQPTADDTRLPTLLSLPLISHCLKSEFDDNAAGPNAKKIPATALQDDCDKATVSGPDEMQMARTDSLTIKGFLLNHLSGGVNTAMISKLKMLTHLNLSNNFLTKLESLKPLQQLVELTLENNMLKGLDDLGPLPELRRLELGRNKIATISDNWITFFPGLMFLSVEDNQVTSILKLQGLPALMEAYFGGNRVTNGKEVNQLRDLPKLIIMDLSGNPCCGEEFYRLYTIFQLKKLKVLDGVSVDASETQRARDKFAGRINAELLNERLGGDGTKPGRPWNEAEELSLASCALKEVTLMDTFVRLKHLKLDHNALVDISGLVACKNIVSLNLAYNKLGTHPVGNVLEQLHRLESISLESNGIQSLAVLQLKIPELKFLNVKSNDIMKIDGLEALPQLRELMIDKNKLRSIDRDCFIYNHQLRELYAEENSIKTIEGVRAVNHLIKLSLAVNRISEIGEIDRGVGGLHSVIEVCFLGNAVVRKTMYRLHVVHMLQGCTVIDNKEVTLDEKERADQVFTAEQQIPPNVFTDVRSPPAVSVQVSNMPNPPSGVYTYQQANAGRAVGGNAGIRLVNLDGGQEAQAGVVGRGRGGTNAGLPGGGGMRGPNTTSAGAGGYRTGSAEHPTAGGGTSSVRPRGKMSGPATNLPRRR